MVAGPDINDPAAYSGLFLFDMPPRPLALEPLCGVLSIGGSACVLPSGATFANLPLRLCDAERRNLGKTRFVSQFYRAKANGGAILEFHGHDRLAIHVRAIGGLEVVQLVIVPVTHQNSVSPGDVGILDADGVFRSSTNRQKIFRQLNRGIERAR